MRCLVLILVFVLLCGSAVASDCSQIRDPEIQLACTLQGLRMQMPRMPEKKASKEAPKEDEFYRRELYEYVFRPCALRDAARVKEAKNVDYAVDIVTAAFYTEMVEETIAMVRGQPWSMRVIAYYMQLHVCLMTPRENDES